MLKVQKSSKQLINTLWAYFCQSLTTAGLESVEGGEWPQKLIQDQSQAQQHNNHGNWSWNKIQTGNPWICSQTRYWLCYGAWSLSMPKQTVEAQIKLLLNLDQIAHKGLFAIQPAHSKQIIPYQIVQMSYSNSRINTVWSYSVWLFTAIRAQLFKTNDVVS